MPFDFNNSSFVPEDKVESADFDWNNAKLEEPKNSFNFDTATSEEDLSFVSDLVTEAEIGVTSGLQGLSSLIGANGARDYYRGKTESLSKELSPEQKAADSEQIFTKIDSEGSSFNPFNYDWNIPSGKKVAGLLSQALPSTALGMGIGGVVTKGLGIAGNLVGRNIASVAVKGGVPLAKIAVKNKGAITGAVGFGTGESIVGAGQAGAQVYDGVMAMKFDVLKQSPVYQDLIRSGKSDIEARHDVAVKAQNQAEWDVGITTALLGAPMGVVFGKWFGKNIASKNAVSKAFSESSRLGNITLGAAGEGAQELSQGAAESVFQNKATRDYANPSQDLGEGMFENMTSGALAGTVMGAGVGAVAPVSQQNDKAPAKPTDTIVTPQADATTDITNFADTLSADSVNEFINKSPAEAMAKTDADVSSINEVRETINRGKASSEANDTVFIADLETKAAQGYQPLPDEIARYESLAAKRQPIVKTEATAADIAEMQANDELQAALNTPQQPEQANTQPDIAQPVMSVPTQAPDTVEATETNLGGYLLAKKVGNINPDIRVFKSAKEANLAVRAHKGFEVVDLKGQVALRKIEATAAEYVPNTAQAQPIQQPAKQPKGATSEKLLTRIKQMGGVTLDERANILGESNSIKAGAGNLFRKGGNSLDTLAQSLTEDFNIENADHKVLSDMIRKALDGEQVLSNEGINDQVEQHQKALEAQDKLDDALLAEFGESWQSVVDRDTELSDLQEAFDGFVYVDGNVHIGRSLTLEEAINMEREYEDSQGITKGRNEAKQTGDPESQAGSGQARENAYSTRQDNLPSEGQQKLLETGKPQVSSEAIKLKAKQNKELDLTDENSLFGATERTEAKAKQPDMFAEPAPATNKVVDDKADNISNKAKLIDNINNKEWWRTQENETAKKERGLFLASSYEEAEFYGRPIDTPFKANVNKPLIGDEKTIHNVLGVPSVKDDESLDDIFATDKKLAESAVEKGYDSIVLMSEKGYAAFSENGKIPKRIELNDLTTTDAYTKAQNVETVTDKATEALNKVADKVAAAVNKLEALEKKSVEDSTKQEDNQKKKSNGDNGLELVGQDSKVTNQTKIEDFGEKIGGAAKDLYGLYSEKMDKAGNLDIATVPLSQSFPEPNYQKLIESGADSRLVSLARVLRDDVPDKPRGRYARTSMMARYSEKVENSRKLAEDAIKLSIANESNDMEEMLSPTYKDKIDLYEAAGHEKSLKGMNLGERFYTLYKGEKNVTFWSVETKGAKTAFSNMPREVAHADTRAEAIEQFKAWYAIQQAAPKEPKGIKFSTYKMRYTGKHSIGKDVGRHQYFFKEDFESTAEARAYLNANHAEIEAHFNAWKEIPAHRRDKNEPRVGDDHRDGKDVTPEMFTEAFGFKGVEFGNWVASSGERQGHLNMAYDALFDLAITLKIPTQAISLGGELALAFGARGRAGAAAHYERDSVVINLTRKQGAGSLAHEWFHAMDNYFSRNRKQPSGFITEKPYAQFNDDTRTELIAAFKDLQSVIKKTGMQERSAKLDTRKAKEYWGTGREMNARAFESYVIASLGDNKHSNDYLANIVPESAFELENEYPYIKASEIKVVKDAFDNLFTTMKTKKTDKGTMLYSRANKTEWDEDFPKIVIHTSGTKMKAHSGYADAKEGNADAALKLVEDLIKPSVIKALKSKFPDAMVVPIRAQEVQGNNMIPAALAEVYGDYGFSIDKGIVQTNTTGRTKKGSALRLALRPEFDGQVIEGQEYIILDDVVGQGGSVAELRFFIESRGGKVVAVSPLTTGIFGTTLPIKADTIIRLEEKHGKQELNRFLNHFNAAGNVSALTEKEGRFILGRPSLNSIRDSIIEEAARNGISPDAWKTQRTILNSLADSEVSGISKSDAEQTLIGKFGNAVKRAISNGKTVIVNTASELPDNIKKMAAWHGSPHNHDKFSMANVGTGEGAQAYGYGLYFAGRRAVGEHYKEYLGGTDYIYKVDSKRVDIMSLGWSDKNAIESLAKPSTYGTPDEVLARLEDDGVSSQYLEELKASFAKYEGKVEYSQKAKGKLYQVELAPKEDEYLLWDKLLSEQSDKVQSAIKDAAKSNEYIHDAIYDYEDTTGNGLYASLTTDLNLDKRASELLHSLGIRGIKYLDGDSRDQHTFHITPPSETVSGKWMVKSNDYNSKGSHFDTESEAKAHLEKELENVHYNYVIFNDADVSITVKYSADGKVKGAYDPATGKTYIVAENNTNETISGVYIHESTHAFFDAKKGEEVKAMAIESIGRAEKMARSGSGKVSAWLKEAKQAVPPSTSREDYHEEILAYAVQKYVDRASSLPASIRAIVEKMVKALKEFISGTTGFKFTDKDHDLIPAILAAYVSQNLDTIANRSEEQGAEWRQAVAKGLDMSKDARMKRAKAMGFDVDTVYYHGSHDFGETIDMSNYGEGEGGQGYGYGFHVTKTKDTANDYTYKLGEKEKRIYELLIPRADSLLDWALPLNEQSGAVIESLRSASMYYNTTQTGEDLYYDIAEGMGDEFGGDLDASDFLDSIGIEGIQYTDNIALNMSGDNTDSSRRDDDARDGGHVNVTVFDPSNIRSINAAFDPDFKESANILYSKAANPESVESGALGMPEETRAERYVRLFQDGFNRVKKIQNELIKRGGIVNENNDVYQAEERSSGIIAARLTDLDNEHVKPLLDEMRKLGVSLEALDEYLIVKHAGERNEYIASINPEMQDSGSGVSNADAQATLKRLDKEGLITNLETLAERVYEVNRKAVNDMLKGHLINKETADLWLNQYKYYVPLKGKDGEEFGGGSGRGYEVRNSGVKSAMGRGEGNISESPTAHTIAQSEAAIARSEKMKIGHALVRLIMANPDKSLWSITSNDYATFFGASGELVEGWLNKPVGLIEDNHYTRIMGILPSEMATFKREMEAYKAGKGGKPSRPTKKVMYKVNPNFRNDPDVFTTLIEGKQFSITIKDQVLMEQMKKLNASQLNAFIQHAGTLNRYLAMINTALNPEFVITNFMRDVQTAGINLTGEQGTKMAREVMKAIPSAMKGIFNHTFGDGKHPDAILYEQMRHDGGTIGFFGLEDNETKVKLINKRLHDNNTDTWSTTKRGVRKVRDAIMDANGVVENSSRLAAYKIALNNGFTNKQAASLSKNLTVNFNRKGEMGAATNSLYLFFNASIQGSARIITALKHKRTQQAVGALAMSAFALAAYNMGAGGDDDDGVSHWEKIPDYIKQTNIIVMKQDGTYLKFRLPYGYNAFWYAGTAVHDLMFGVNTTAMKTTFNMGTTILNAFNPIQGADILDTIIPTALKPIEQDVRNINFMKIPIRPENKYEKFADLQPDSGKAWSGTAEWMKDFTKFLNDSTGGNDSRQGLVDVSPETIKHYFGWVTGGAGMTAFRTFNVVSDTITGDAMESRNIPLARTFLGDKSTRYDSDRYYEILGELNTLKNEREDLIQAKDKQGAVKFLQKNRSNIMLEKRIGSTNKKLKALRNKKKEAYLNKDSAEVKRLQERIAKIQMDFTSRYTKP